MPNLVPSQVPEMKSDSPPNDQIIRPHSTIQRAHSTVIPRSKPSKVETFRNKTSFIFSWNSF